jgi:hypothetical protein
MLIILSLVLSYSCFYAQETFGKSENEVLSMKLDDWVKFYQTNSTGSKDEGAKKAYDVYSAILKKKNLSDIQRIKAEDKSRVEKYYSHIIEFNRLLFEMGKAHTNPKPDWDVFSSKSFAEIEILMKSLIEINTKPTKSPTAEKFWEISELIGEVRKTIAKYIRITPQEREKMDAQKRDWRTALKFSADVLKNYDAVLPMLPRERQDECIAVLKTYKIIIDSAGLILDKHRPN